MHDSGFLPDDLGLQRFAEQYWQRRPLLLRQVELGRLPTITPDELWSLAQRADSASRLVECADDPRDWRVSRGPFGRRERDRLPESGWTLLVQEIDRSHAGFAALLDRFRFVPNWRVDDVMVSYATDGGGVGPHIDRYDVFLLQLEGRRRWRIDTTPVREERLAPGVELPMLATFEHDREWLLDPGDMLYLPPRIAHEGTALGSCITCSIGFRVPDPRELSAGFLRQLSPRTFDQLRHALPDPVHPPSLGEISADARHSLRESVRRLFADDEALDGWIGRFVTTPLRTTPPHALSPIGSIAELHARLASGQTLIRSAPSHFAWLRLADGSIELFIGGEPYRLGPEDQERAELLCGRRSLDRGVIEPWLREPSLATILLDAILRGYLTFSSGSAGRLHSRRA